MDMVGFNMLGMIDAMKQCLMVFGLMNCSHSHSILFDPLFKFIVEKAAAGWDQLQREADERQFNQPPLPPPHNVPPLPLKTHEETVETTLSVPENAIVKRPGTLQHGDDVDPEDEDEDGPEVEVMEIGPVFGDEEYELAF